MGPEAHGVEIVIGHSPAASLMGSGVHIGQMQVVADKARPVLSDIGTGGKIMT